MFAPDFAVRCAERVRQQHGADAWMRFVNTMTAHVIAECWARRFSHREVKPYPIGWARAGAEQGRNVRNPHLKPMLRHD